MNDFEGLLAPDYGFKPQGKSAPMAAPKGSSAASGGTLNYDNGSRGTFQSVGNSNSFGGSFVNDGDSIFGSLSNQKNQDIDGFGDLFRGSTSARYTSKSENHAADSPFNLDTMYRAPSVDTGSKYTSAPPVFDKPLYDDDIFEGVPGLKSSAEVNYDDVFASVASDQEPGSGAATATGGNDVFDDLLGGFGKVDREFKSSDGKRGDKDDDGVAGFEDLLPGFGGSRAPTGRPTSEPIISPQASVSSAKNMSDEAYDPFKLFESASIRQAYSSAHFIDPLEEISRLSSSASRKLNSSSVSNAKSTDDIDPFDGLGESVPAFSSERNNRKDSSPSKTDTGTARTPTDKESCKKSSIRSPERRSQNMNHVDHDNEFSQASFSTSAHSSNDNTFEESNVNVDMPPKYEGNFESDDDVWLVVSEITLFTQPTAAPPPSRPPPPRPLQVRNSEFGSAAYKNTNGKGSEFSSSTSTQYSQAPKFASVAARISTTSPFDELDDFAMGRSHGGDDELATGISGEELEMNTVAAAMKEAMDRAETKFRHAKGVREREGTKVMRRETVQLEREGKTVQEEREKQEMLRLQKEMEEKERLEKEREKEKEQRRLEREKERARELERERARERQAVERATREARERAAIEARSRAERAAVEKANAEARERAERAAVQRAQAEARERAVAEAKGRAEKAAAEARERANAEARTENEVRLRAERAAAERAAAEARERAAAAAAAKMNQQKNDSDLDSFFSMGSRPNSASRPRTNPSDSVFDNPFQNRQEPSVAKRSAEASSSIRKTSSANFVDDLSSIFGAASSSGEFQVVEGETEERRRARLERHQRTQERTAKALAEKNERDLQTERDQAERHRIAETLDIEIKRWAAGKEGNLRALLSTLQYVLWPECGWQPVSLTDLITGASVKKVYRKATLCIHPDKVQQKGANLQQKYIAEKVFDLLKEAWNKLSSEELF